MRIIFLLIIIVFNACKQHPERYGVDWREISSKEYSVKFVHLTSEPFISDVHIEKRVVDYVDFDTTAIFLSDAQKGKLSEIINDPRNFSGGECGTFALNGGFIIFHNDTIVGVIEAGCGYGQWNFEPRNKGWHDHLLNGKGAQLRDVLLDDLYKNLK